MSTMSDFPVTTIRAPSCDCVSPDEHLCRTAQEPVKTEDSSEEVQFTKVKDELGSIKNETSAIKDEPSTTSDELCTIEDELRTDNVEPSKIENEACKIRIVKLESLAENVGVPRKKPRQTKPLPPSEERSFICIVCGKGFKTRHKLIFHQTSVHEEARYKCKECNKCFSQTGSLNRHMQMVHRKVRASPCPHCGKSFSSSHYLKFHIDNVHLGSSTNMCSECGKGFYNANNLRMHIDSVHRQVLSHFCDRCGKGFVQVGNLTRHIESVHDGIKRFPCECGKAFSSAKSLSRHRFSRNHKMFYDHDKMLTEAFLLSLTKEIQANRLRELQGEEGNRQVPVINVDDDDDDHASCEEMEDNAECRGGKDVCQETEDEISIVPQEKDEQPKTPVKHMDDTAVD